MQQWITADLHLGEDRFDLMQRPVFANAQEMIDLFVKNHNSVVSPDDIVQVVGDVVYQKAPQFLEQISRFNGKKILYRGNHDRVFSDSDLSPYFSEIVPEGECRTANFAGVECNIVHYPTLGVNDKFNLVGHVHGAWKFQLNSFNVGVDANHYFPHNVERIPFYLEAISKYYDNDVWAAYLPCNQEFQSTRGKKANYFERT